MENKNKILEKIFNTPQILLLVHCIFCGILTIFLFVVFVLRNHPSSISFVIAGLLGLIQYFIIIFFSLSNGFLFFFHSTPPLSIIDDELSPVIFFGAMIVYFVLLFVGTWYIKKKKRFAPLVFIAIVLIMVLNFSGCVKGIVQDADRMIEWQEEHSHPTVLPPGMIQWNGEIPNAKEGTVKFKEFTFQYPETYSIDFISGSSVNGYFPLILEKKDAGRLEIYEKDRMKIYPGFEEDALKKEKNNFGFGLKEIIEYNANQVYEIWFFYKKDDEQTKQELHKILNSFKKP